MQTPAKASCICGSTGALLPWKQTHLIFSYLQSCRSRLMVHSLLCTCQSPSQAHKPDSIAPLGSRLTHVTPARAGSSPPAPGLDPPAECHFLVSLVLRFYPSQDFGVNRFARWMQQLEGVTWPQPSSAPSFAGSCQVWAETCSDSPQQLKCGSERLCSNLLLQVESSPA